MTAPASKPRSRPEFGFERDYGARQRDREAAKAEAKVLAVRLQGPDADPLPEPLIRVAQEIVLNIAWYEREITDLRKRRRVWIALVVMLIVGAFTALGVILFGGTDSDGAPMAHFSALIAGIFGLLQLLAQLTDTSRRMAAFHKARARLKELLYSFETQWRGKAFGDDGLAPEVEAAVGEMLRQGRAVVDEEQREFFDSLASPTSLLDGLTGSTTRLKDEVNSALARAAERRDEATDAVARRNAQGALERARARQRAAQRWLERLEVEVAADSPEVEAARQRVRDAEREVIEAEETLASVG
ncbi:MAG: hypothetical protein KC620_15980 [Myxococcales bacterium]|nr:hypothetical protein [Myxococcales bacterium]